MQTEYPSIDVLINEVKGTTGFLSNLLSKKSGLVFMFIVLGAIVSKLFFG